MRHRSVLGKVLALASGPALALGLLAPAAAGAPATGTARLGSGWDLAGPTSEAVTGSDVWITERAGDAVTEITASGSLVRVVAGAADRLDRPGPVVADGADVWVASRSGLTELDATTGGLVRTVSAGAMRMGRPAALAAAGPVIVVVGAGGRITEVAAASGAVLRTERPGRTGLRGPQAAAFTGRNVWVADTAGDAAVAFRVATLRRVHRVTASSDGLSAPDGISFDGRHLWVADAGSTGVTELTTGGALVRFISNSTGDYGFMAPGAVVSWRRWTFISSPPGSSPMITQVTDDNGAADWYMCNTNGPYHFADPTGLAVAGGRLWVANQSGDSLTEMDAASGALIATFT